MTTPGNGRDLWLRNYHPAPRAPVQLFCFPHAGGSASFFAPLTRALSPAVDVIAVQYPGRQGRRHEPNVSDLHEVADIVSADRGPADRAVRAQHGRLALLQGRPAASGPGRPGPGAAVRVGTPGAATTTVHLLPDEGRLADVRQLSGIDPRILGDDEMLRLALPAIRSGYPAAERYVMRPGPPLSCPITVLATTDESARRPTRPRRGAISGMCGKQRHRLPSYTVDEVE